MLSHYFNADAMLWQGGYKTGSADSVLDLRLHTNSPGP